MLGHANPTRDIPERAGYDRVRLAIESVGSSPLTLERSVEGGDFSAFDELLRDEPAQQAVRVLRQKHSAARQDTVSYSLLERSGLSSKILRQNAAGKTRSLSFRDIARFCVVTEEKIQGRGSPLLSGQYVNATVEYATFKLLATGTDDSALVRSRDQTKEIGHHAGKLELLDEFIEGLQRELDEEDIEEGDLRDRVARLEGSLETQKKSLTAVQAALNVLLQRRATAAREVRDKRARLTEIDELIGRFALLDEHYSTDLKRLAAIRESGSLFVHLSGSTCPLCGAGPAAQHLESPCDGNVEAVVGAADAEILKIETMRHELHDTVARLKTERAGLRDSLRPSMREYRLCEEEMKSVASPAVATEQTTYGELVDARAEVRLQMARVERLNDLVAERQRLDRNTSEAVAVLAQPGTDSYVPTNVVDSFAQLVEAMLQDWHFPNAARVFFDQKKRDFQIAGKERGNTGKGLRAITHAAVKIGLMEFCRSRELPHPGFVVLDSPLLAYWKPEGEEDDLRGTDLKDRFYEYILGLSSDSQVIVVENEHPPDFVASAGNVIVFTKNPNRGRYGFFPQ